MKEDFEMYVGRGIYSVPEAARLTGVSAGRINRWLFGYRHNVAGHTWDRPPVIRADYPKMHDRKALSFLDLIEIRIIDAFISAGVSWRDVREAETRARQLLRVTHPFCTNRLKTDGTIILIELPDGSGREHLLELHDNQQVFAQIVSKFLKDLEFSAQGTALRWWPWPKSRLIVIDPQRGFGHPILARYGVPTSTISQACKAGNIRSAAKWYDVDYSSARAAVAFERAFAA